MIALRKMNEDQYRGFIDYFISDYAIEIMQNYNKNKENALRIAMHEISIDLPEGIHTKSNVLLCIDREEKDSSELIGYLWYKENIGESSIFIYDFYIQPEYRNKGYGKRSMIMLEDNLKNSQIKQIKLRVAYSNEKALALYKELGFNITGINMAKNIIDNEES